jgi:hypothetical protein
MIEKEYELDVCLYQGNTEHSLVHRYRQMTSEGAKRK